MDENMYMSMSIGSGAVTTIPNKTKNFARDRNPADCGDIDGAKPSNRYTRYLGKPDLFNNFDIDGSSSMTLHKPRNGPVDSSLRVDDIDGAKARIRDKFHFTKRYVDPLNPDYPLPSFTKPEPYVPKFIKDPLDKSDIDGAQVKPLVKYDVRTVNRTDDIEGAQASWRPRHARIRLESEPRNILECNDISRRTHRFIDHTNRETDPVDPVYNVNGMELKSDERYTKPKPNPKFHPENFQLKTSDIEGAYPGWRPPMILNPPIEKRREFRNTNYIGDIDGAKADTIKHSITTKRETNPLNPIYKGLDPGVILRGPTDPLIPADIYSKPTVLIKGSTTSGLSTMKMGEETINLPGAYRRKSLNNNTNNNNNNDNNLGTTFSSDGVAEPKRPLSEPNSGRNNNNNNSTNHRSSYAEQATGTGTGSGYMSGDKTYGNNVDREMGYKTNHNNSNNTNNVPRLNLSSQSQSQSKRETTNTNTNTNPTATATATTRFASSFNSGRFDSGRGVSGGGGGGSGSGRFSGNEAMSKAYSTTDNFPKAKKASDTNTNSNRNNPNPNSRDGSAKATATATATSGASPMVSGRVKMSPAERDREQEIRSVRDLL